MLFFFLNSCLLQLTFMTMHCVRWGTQQAGYSSYQSYYAVVLFCLCFFSQQYKIDFFKIGEGEKKEKKTYHHDFKKIIFFHLPYNYKGVFYITSSQYDFNYYCLLYMMFDWCFFYIEFSQCNSDLVSLININK